MKVNEAYNLWAESYDTVKNKTRDLELTVGQSILKNNKYSKIIELGCGTGKNTEWLSEKCDSIIGVDFSSEMLAIAKSKINSKNIQFLKADILQEWNFDRVSADLITSSLVLEHIKDLDFIFSQANKTLKQNGLFYLCELHPFKQYIGSKARFELNDNIIELETYIHHISDYLQSAIKNNFELVNFNEWFDSAERNEIPRLVSFLFKAT
jgi:ubiquinone/menaquinone biosynthesis C-methylase UbiE